MLVIGSTVVVIAAGVGLYYYSSSSPPPPPKKPSKKSKKKSKKTGNKSPLTEGSVIEEIPDADKGPSLEAIMAMTETEINNLPADVRSKYAAKLKTTGNTAYQERKFEPAIKYYSQAILFKADPVFYSNRAACYTNIEKYDNVVSDCTDALKLDKAYVKALVRRAVAYEHLEKYKESLLDFTAASIIDEFKNQTATQAVERLLRKIAEIEAAKIMRDRKPRLPSITFTHAYFQAFRKVEFEPIRDAQEGSGDAYFNEANRSIKSQQYQEAAEAFQKAIDLDTSHLAQAYNMTGTFKFIQGDARGALQDLDMAIELEADYTQSYVKRASIHMELGAPEKAFGDFDTAIAKKPDDPDVYYHRGQIYFITNEFDKAISDYTKSIELDPEFVFAHIQQGVAQYKLGSVASSMVTFRKTLKKFPKSPDVYNYYGELLMDQQKFAEAVDKFEQAMVLEKELQTTPATMNVLPLINQALCVFQWKQDMKQAEELCKKALILDADCDLAVATLSQLLLQQGRIEESLEYFERAASLARTGKYSQESSVTFLTIFTEAELVNTLSYQEATKVQLEFVKQYPEHSAKIRGAMAGPAGMAA